MDAQFAPNVPAVGGALHDLADAVAAKIRKAKARCWVLTEHDTKKFTTWKEFDIECQKIRYFCYQLEQCPETGKIHIQGYIEFYDQVRMGQVKSRLGSDKVHLEVRKGTRIQARDYARKDDSPYFTSFYPDWSEHGGRLVGTKTVERGTFRTKQGCRTDLQQMVDKIREGACEYSIWTNTPEMYLKYGNNARKAIALERKRALKNQYVPIDVHVLYGDTRSGKTRTVYDRHGPENVYIPVYSESAGKFWFDGYDGEKVLLINEFYGQARTSIMQQLLDHYRMRVETKGGTTYSSWDTIYITSNCHPKDWYRGWESIPQSVEDSFIERITSIQHMVRKADKQVKTWSDCEIRGAPEVVGSPVLPPPLPNPNPRLSRARVRNPDKRKKKPRNPYAYIPVLKEANRVARNPLSVAADPRGILPPAQPQ